MKKILHRLVEESTDSVENNGIQYYYQCGEYKFQNSFLAHWYANEVNGRATYVALPTSLLRERLAGTKIDLEYDYHAEFLKKLRSRHNDLHLFFSGGSDSLLVLHKANDHGIVFDEIISQVYGSDIDHPANQEIKYNALPAIKKYSNAYKKFSITYITRDMLCDFYSDPLILWKIPYFQNSIPVFVQRVNAYTPFYTQSNDCDTARIVGPDKPQLLLYKNSWYVVLLDTGRNAKALSQEIFFTYEPDNIRGLIKDAILYRNHLNSSVVMTDTPQFFKLSSRDDNSIIDRPPTPSYDHIFKKYEQGRCWPEKHALLLADYLQNQDIELLSNYFAALNSVLDFFPHYKKTYSTDRTLFPAQMGWAINIDTLEVFTQQELIPNGF